MTRGDVRDLKLTSGNNSYGTSKNTSFGKQLKGNRVEIEWFKIVKKF